MLLKCILFVYLLAVCEADSVPDGPVLYIFSSGLQDIESGTFNANDTVLTQFDVMQPRVLINWSSMTIRYPPDGVNADQTITYIKVTDKIRDGYNGFATITHGGVGQKMVTLQIKSKLHRPVDFRVTIMGK